MEKIGLTLFGMAMALVATAETFKVDPAHSSVDFAIKHMMVSTVKGSFDTFQGSLDYDIATHTLKSVEGSVDAGSINTNNGQRDNHLRGNDFFDVEKFPKITFNSTSVKKLGENIFEVSGNLNILGKDHPTTTSVVISGPVDGRNGNKLIGAEGTATLDRNNLGLSYGTGAMIGTDVKIDVSVEAIFKQR